MDEDEMMVDTPVPMSRQASADPLKPGMAEYVLLEFRVSARSVPGNRQKC